MATTKIASVYFAPVSAKRNYRGSAYKIPAVPFGSAPYILEIRDLFQRSWETVAGTSKRQEKRDLVTGEEIARCLVGEWTGTTTVSLGMNPDCRPGIWVVRDRIPVTEKHQKMVDNETITYEERMALDGEGKTMFRPATEEESEEMWAEDLAAAREADRRYAEWCWSEGNRIAMAWTRGGDLVPRQMPTNYRLAAKHYGMDADWLKQGASIDSMECPHCGKLTPKAFMMCQACTQPIDLKRWAAFTVAKDAAMKEVSAPGYNSGKKPLPPPVQNPTQAQA